MKPNLLRWLAIAMSAANQDSVSHDAPCARFSFLQAAAAAAAQALDSEPATGVALRDSDRRSGGVIDECHLIQEGFTTPRRR